GGGNERQAHAKSRTHARFALEIDAAPHQFAQPLDDSEAEAGAFARHLIIRLQSRERLEQLARVLRLDADAGVADLAHDAVRGLVAFGFRAFDGHVEAYATVIGELDGIVEQVEQDLLNADAV